MLIARSTSCARSRGPARATTTSTSTPPRERGIPIVYAPGVGSRPIAEGTLALILAAAKRLRELGASGSRRRWSARYDTAPLDIEGACLGVDRVRIDRPAVARLCAAWAWG